MQYNGKKGDSKKSVTHIRAYNFYAKLRENGSAPRTQGIIHIQDAAAPRTETESRTPGGLRFLLLDFRFWLCLLAFPTGSTTQPEQPNERRDPQATGTIPHPNSLV